MDPYRARLSGVERHQPGGLRVLGHFHGYPPHQNAGAEWYAHEVMVGLRDRGADVRVLNTTGRTGEPLEGIAVTRDRQAYRWADVVLTHLDCTRRAVTLAKQSHRPVVHLVHNHRQLAHWRVRRSEADLVVANSRWVADTLHWPGPMVVARPHVPVARYTTKPGDRVTLVNLYPDKGADVFWHLAERMPDVGFLGVRGGYGTQDVRTLPNVDVVDNTPRMRDDVYARTKVLVVPSVYESWGRVAVEAMCSGIPVVACPTSGLRESLGDAGVFATTADDFAAEVRRLLDDPAWYAHCSAASRRRAVEVEQVTSDDLDRLCSAVRSLVSVPVAA
ncbi:MAG TPA: glycosyltransferase family 4 protein [Acidimicrobiales bacterium]|jgi:glycosyltransferase involved in cell wall biosynthesis